MSATPTDKPARADARRNRERLIAAAAKLFAKQGTDVSLAAVAQAAGVGTGTVYRHFPSHDELVEAVYRNEVEQLCRRGDELLRELPGDEALAAWMGRFVEYLATKRGMADALCAVVASGSTVHADARREIAGTLTKLLEAGAADGTLRSDVDAEDVLAAFGGIWLIRDQPEQAGRILSLTLDGLRHGARG